MVNDLPLADELAAVAARMSGLLLSHETVTSALTLVTTLAKETVPGALGAGVTLLDQRGRRVSAATTDDAVARADELQYEFDEGPCLSAWERRTTVRVDDTSREARWPRWCRAVHESGTLAALSTPMVAGGDALGAIKVYSDRSGAFDDHDEHLLTMFAAQAAVLLANVRTVANAQRLSSGLRDAMHDRDTVSMAKGILMGREGTDEETAFMMLAADAQGESRKLSDVADALVRSATRNRR